MVRLKTASILFVAMLSDLVIVLWWSLFSALYIPLNYSFRFRILNVAAHLR